MKKIMVFVLSLIVTISLVGPVQSSAKVVDKNKNKISDSWEKKYKLTGKNLAKKDPDRDGLSNLVEYRLKLNPKKKDTNNNKVPDGREDTDRDGISNLAEIDLGLNPAKAYSKKKNVKDGNLKDVSGVAWSKKVKELDISIESGRKELDVEYEIIKGKEKILIEQTGYNLTKKQVRTLVTQLQNDITNKTSKTKILNKIKNQFNLSGYYEIDIELEYMNGREIEISQEIENPNDDDD
ncbi:MAG: hypothetical protein KBT36_07065 [Kurthia sp.]|nr:hypothetical protein [Candidatus Kurthia equi]